jgi:hypothetical protein
VHVTSQREVDALAGVCVITGQLKIEGRPIVTEDPTGRSPPTVAYEGPTNLASLHSLKDVGTLWVFLTGLENLDGLSSLEHVRGVLWIVTNHRLKRLSLPSLKSIGEHLTIDRNGVQDLNLPELTVVRRNVYFIEGDLSDCSVHPLIERLRRKGWGGQAHVATKACPGGCNDGQCSTSSRP